MFNILKWLDFSYYFSNKTLVTKRMEDLENELNALDVENQVLKNNLQTMTYSNMSTDALTAIYLQEKEEAEKRLVDCEVDLNELCQYNQDLKEELETKDNIISSLNEVIDEMKLALNEYEEALLTANSFKDIPYKLI